MVSLGNCWGGGSGRGEGFGENKAQIYVSQYAARTQILKEPLHAYLRWRRYKRLTEDINRNQEGRETETPLIGEERSLEEELQWGNAGNIETSDWAE